MSELLWKIHQDPLFKKNAALYSTLDGRVAVIIPLHDPRDGDWNGVVSFGEWAIGGALGLGGVLESAEMSRLMQEIAVKECDFEMKQAGEQQLLATMFAAVSWGFKMVYVDRWAGAVGKLATAGMAAAPVTQFLVRKSLEAAIKRTYDAAVGALTGVQ